MAKEKDKGFFTELLNSFLSNKLMDIIRNAIDEAVDKTKRSIYETQRRILVNLVFSFIILFGVIFIFIGSVFLLSYYLNLNIGWSFVIVGFSILIIAIIFKFFSDLKNR